MQLIVVPPVDAVGNGLGPDVQAPLLPGGRDCVVKELRVPAYTSHMPFAQHTASKHEILNTKDGLALVKIDKP